MDKWLLKSEPHTWSWQDQEVKRVTPWDGVRNYQADGYLRQMKRGDEAFFYHSNKDREIVGIVQVIRPYYSDPEAPRFGMVDVEYSRSFIKPVTLKVVKEHPLLSHLPLIKQSRLSVMPIDEESWNIILNLGGLR